MFLPVSSDGAVFAGATAVFGDAAETPRAGLRARLGVAQRAASTSPAFRPAPQAPPAPVPAGFASGGSGCSGASGRFFQAPDSCAADVAAGALRVSRVLVAMGRCGPSPAHVSTECHPLWGTFRCHVKP